MRPTVDTFTLPGTDKKVGTGWLRPLPDLRDYTTQTPAISESVALLNIGTALDKGRELPHTVDLRRWCSPITDQQTLGACTAFAAMGIVEYLENRAFRGYQAGSPLFVYKATRNLLGWSGDTGAFLRTTMGALAMLGVPPESYWPYNTNTDPAAGPTFDDEPSAFVYGIADNFEGTHYVRHDPFDRQDTPEAVLRSIKMYLAAGIPSMFGFLGFGSFSQSDIPGGIPFPGPDEAAQWGHGISAVGYDDALQITNTAYNITTTGALLIRNSWGTGWGDAGYGWLPYEYVLKRFAEDFWSLLGMRWVRTGAFGL